MLAKCSLNSRCHPVALLRRRIPCILATNCPKPTPHRTFLGLINGWVDVDGQTAALPRNQHDQHVHTLLLSRLHVAMRTTPDHVVTS